MIKYFYHLDYLVKARVRSNSEKYGRRPSSSLSPPLSPIRRRRSKGKKLNLKMIEDPLLAQAMTGSWTAPLTPPQERDNVFEQANGKMAMSEDESEDDEEAVEAESLEQTMAEHESCDSTPYLTTHAKVYAIAEK